MGQRQLVLACVQVGTLHLSPPNPPKTHTHTHHPQALFKSAEESIQAHREHLKDEGLLDGDNNNDGDKKSAAAGDGRCDGDGAAAGGGAAKEEQQQPQPPQQRLRHVTRFFCASCNRVHDHEEPIDEAPPVITPQPGESVCVIECDRVACHFFCRQKKSVM